MLIQLLHFLTPYGCRLLRILISLKVLQTKTFFVRYFTLIESIRVKERGPLLWYHLFTFALILLVISKAFHYLVLSLLQDALTEYQNVLQYNYIAMEGQPAYFNFYTAMYILLSLQCRTLPKEYRSYGNYPTGMYSRE